MECMLWLAVKGEDLVNARYLIKKGCDVDEKRYGTSCLLKAIKTCNLDMVKLLLESGADTNSTDNRGNGPLHIALQIDDAKKRLLMTKLLLECHALRTSFSNHGPTYVHGAVRIPDFNLVQLLLDAGAQLNCSDRCSPEGAAGNPLHTAIKYLEGKVRCDMMEKLIRAGADVDSKDYEGNSCLHHAVECGTYNEAWELIFLLLNAGAKINCVNDKGISPLAAAVKKGDYRLLKKMIHAGAKVKISKSCTGSALHIAVKSCDERIVKLLLDKGATVNALDDDGKNILYYAVKYFDPTKELECMSILKILLMHGAAVNSKRYANFAPFGAVLRYGNEAMMNLFFENGIRKDMCGIQFPLQHAALNNNLEILECLLKSRRYDIDSLNMGCTTLAAAVRFGPLSSVQLLLEWGADPNIPITSSENLDSDISLTPLSQALCERETEYADLLFSGGAVLDRLTMESFSILNFDFKKRRQINMVGHILLLKDQGHPIPSEAERFIKEEVRNVSKLINLCQTELETLKETVLHGSVTLYDILVGQDITPYMSNKDFMDKFDSVEVVDNFQVYGSKIKYRFLLSQSRRNLLDETKYSLKKVLGKRRINCDSILYEIMSYLHVKDLRNLSGIETHK
ncbi:hypothetical protein QAD02_004823 [Eretmocerus hayati]|uniref:Uncharacterized protein n=1 Tax=Eretmocerus hayati TaxID=131215 RepID=A0ACC2NRP7_9HYME|nr:hypothetical protein QAD02_004823 [Eretmocerus hayati]